MGFFTPTELEKETEVQADKKRLEPNCIKCGLYRKCKHPKMKVSGDGKKGILIISEAPSEKEDDFGTPLIGEAGKILRKQLKKAGISITRDCYKINAVNCRVNTAKPPTKNQITYCRPYVEKIIYRKEPRLIITCGNVALNSLFGEDFNKNTMDKWRGVCVPDEKYTANIMPIYHPSSILKDEKNRNFKGAFERDIQNVLENLSKRAPVAKDYEKYVRVLTNFDAVVKALNHILKTSKKIYIDYEATGLKPQRKGHKLVSVAIATGPKEAIAFPFNHTDIWTKDEFKVIHDLYAKILQNKNIKKMAHGMKFENSWSINHVSEVSGWYWCTMNGAHILDNRRGFTALKFQTFIKFGVRPYDKHMKKYLKAKKGTEFNTVEKAPLKDLLVYNGLDVIFGWMLYEDQKNDFYKEKKKGRKHLLDAFALMHKSLLVMGNIQETGINVDEEYYSQKRKELKKRINDLKDYLNNGREARKFRKKFHRNIKITSNKDLGKLFYEVLGVPPIYTNEKCDNYKTDKKTLERLKLPFTTNLQDMKRLTKAKDTYIKQFQREMFDGIMHPLFDLHIPATYRSSSSKPNFQNIPKRDEEIKKIIRAGIRPSPGCVLVECDFSGAEVITSACYHKDTNFINYLMDPSSDMHRDVAGDLFMLDTSEITKLIRFYSKNMWTFAQFYGDWYGACAPNLWENCLDLETASGVLIRSHLEDMGIYDLETFTEHCKTVEQKMWYETFPEYTQWKEDIVDFYNRHGYIETYLGFVFRGYMTRNQCCNYPIQGTSFHLLLYTLIQVQKFIKRHNLKTRLIGQIHDSIISNTPVSEKEFYLQGVNKIVKGLKDKFEWLIIPMEIEAEVSKSYEQGGSFAEMEDYKL